MPKKKRYYNKKKVFKTYDEWIAVWDKQIYNIVLNNVKDIEIAEDIKQDIETYFIEKKGLERFNPKYSSFTTYMIQCIKNKITNYYRDRVRKPIDNVVVSINEDDTLKIAKAQGLLNVCYEEALKRALRALRTLDNKMKRQYKKSAIKEPYTESRLYNIFKLLYINALPRKEVRRLTGYSDTSLIKFISIIKNLPEIKDLLEITFCSDWA